MRTIDLGPTRELNPRLRPRRRMSGFSLIELLVATAVFLIVAGTAFSVFGKHMALITYQENLSGVNLALRNATAQLQMDLAGAGQNLLAGVPNSPTFSAGVIIHNNVAGAATACAPAGSDYTYPVPSACFDSLTIFGLHNTGCAATPNGYPPVLALATDRGNTQSLDSSSIVWATDPNNAQNNTADAACFQSGDEIMLIELATNGQTLNCDNGPFGYCLNVVTLTQQAQVSGSDIQLQHNPTGAGGQPSGCPGASCTDTQGVLYNPDSASGTNYTNSLSAGFSAPAYIVDLGSASSAVTYQVQVDPQNAGDTQLVRCDVNGCAVLADQIIGFKVGAALWNNEQGGQPDIANYFYDAKSYCSEWNGADCNTPPVPKNDAYDYSLVRAVRASLVGRTTPSTDVTLNKFANGFDGGPYLVQQASVVVDLRNLSIADFQN